MEEFVQTIPTLDLVFMETQATRIGRAVFSKCSIIQSPPLYKRKPKRTLQPQIQAFFDKNAVFRIIREWRGMLLHGSILAFLEEKRIFT